MRSKTELPFKKKCSHCVCILTEKCNYCNIKVNIWTDWMSGHFNEWYFFISMNDISFKYDINRWRIIIAIKQLELRAMLLHTLIFAKIDLLYWTQNAVLSNPVRIKRVYGFIGSWRTDKSIPIFNKYSQQIWIVSCIKLWPHQLR